MAFTPPATHVAPISPPKSACDELDGSPRYQVVRFHKIAPTSPAKITTGLMSVSSTSPPEIVFATWTERNAPTRLRTPAITTATLGRSAPVAIEVAMAFAVSWKPFVKSKINAVRTTTTTIRDSYTAASFARPDAGAGRGCGVVRNSRAARPNVCGPTWAVITRAGWSGPGGAGEELHPSQVACRRPARRRLPR